jgi:hypothetical protein
MKKNIFSISLVVILSLMITIVIFSCSTSDNSGGESGDNNGGGGTTVDLKTRYFAYVANYFSNKVSAYSINASTGALSVIAGSPYDNGAGTNPVSIKIIKTVAE